MKQVQERCDRPNVTADACSYPWTWAMVTADGVVYPCCFAKAPIGNLNDNSFEEIWNGRTILELRYFVDHNQVHWLCRGAVCSYGQAKAATTRPHEVVDCRYAFLDVAERREGEDVAVSGKVVNCGETAWFLFDYAGTIRVQIGGRVIDPGTGTTLSEVRHPIPGEALFPGESAPFKFQVKPQPGALLKLDICNEGYFWFEERGATSINNCALTGERAFDRQV